MPTGKEVVKRAIPNALACDALVQLIKDNGRWQEPPAPEDNGSSPASGPDAKKLVNA